jgi:exodeoxyribonuclease VII small subunit
MGNTHVNIGDFARMAKRSKDKSREGREPVSFEKTLAELRQIVELLDSGETGLDESLKLYERGVKTYRQCREILDVAEKRVQVLVRKLDGTLEAEDVDDPRKTTQTPFAEGEDAADEDEQ